MGSRGQAIELDSYVVDFVLCTASEAHAKARAEAGAGAVASADGKGEAKSESKAESKGDGSASSSSDPLPELRVFIIEINPFAEFAGSGLFSWVDDKPVRSVV